ncbi:MAG: hypothetical protein P8Z37_07450 [Acidobacteriota bacterium]
MTGRKSPNIVLIILMAMFLSSTASAQDLKNGKHWVSAWSTAMHEPLAFVPG